MQRKGGGGGKQKGTWLPPVTAHPRANRGKSITCRIKQKLVHKVKPSESCTHPSKHSLPSRLFLSRHCYLPPPPSPFHFSDSHQQQCASFRHTLWNPTQVRMFSGPNDPKALTSLMAQRWYIAVFIAVCRPAYRSKVPASWFCQHSTPERQRWLWQLQCQGLAQKNIIFHFLVCTRLYSIFSEREKKSTAVRFLTEGLMLYQTFERDLNSCYRCHCPGLAVSHWAKYHMICAETFRHKSVTSNGYIFNLYVMLYWDKTRLW